MLSFKNELPCKSCAHQPVCKYTRQAEAVYNRVDNLEVTTYGTGETIAVVSTKDHDMFVVSMSCKKWISDPVSIPRQGCSVVDPGHRSGSYTLDSRAIPATYVRGGHEE